MRADALQLLSVVEARLWSGGAAADGAPGEAPAIVVGGIQDTYRQLQLQLSDKLARHPPRMTGRICRGRCCVAGPKALGVVKSLPRIEALLM